MEDKEIEEVEKVFDVKGVIESFIEEEPIEISQKEAIKRYDVKTDMIIKKYTSSSDNEDNTVANIDDEHMKRVKKELIASLDRVNAMEKIIFEEIGRDVIKKRKKKYNVGKGNSSLSLEMKQNDKNNIKKEQNNSERSREE